MSFLGGCVLWLRYLFGFLPGSFFGFHAEGFHAKGFLAEGFLAEIAEEQRWNEMLVYNGIVAD